LHNERNEIDGHGVSSCADEGTNTPLMIAQAIVSIRRFLRSLLHALGVGDSAVRCGPTGQRSCVDRTSAQSTAKLVLRIRLNGLARSDAHNDTPPEDCAVHSQKDHPCPTLMLPERSMTAGRLSACVIFMPTLVASYPGAIRDSPEIWLGISLNPTRSSRQRARAVLLLAYAPQPSSGAAGEAGALA
jgi:hypothetical protein